MVDMLAGSDFFSVLGSMLPGLSSPLATFFACSSTFSFGANLVCPGTHWILSSKTPFDCGISVIFCCLAFWNFSAF